ncbi:MAG TPA: response regulator [Methylocystis sp.]|nr:response regulator [Methylocystis sp.]
MKGLDSVGGITEPPDVQVNAARADPLRGVRILIVEDNPFIGAALEEMLTEQGLVVVGVAKRLKEALRYCADSRIDVALLDVNLGDDKIDAVADALDARGAPFVFATGYGRAGLPEAFSDRPVVEKPFYIEEMLKELRGVLRHTEASRTLISLQRDGGATPAT